MRNTGIIPAYAGSTANPWIVHAEHRDHPRIRGEHCTPLSGINNAQGSSPHTRGAHPYSSGGDGDQGIIPAYAGSTRPPPAYAGTTPDHPRIRGEHRGRDGGSGRAGGSSPHTRGALSRVQPGHLAGGIIPAYAGSTVFAHPRKRLEADHPRIRGEHRRAGETAMVRDGSSPHTRGARREFSEFGREFGIIPAYAGSTLGRP